MRTDIHCPSKIVPSDYEFVSLGYEGSLPESGNDSFDIQESYRILGEHLQSTKGKFSAHDHGGNCHICGAHCIYVAYFYHEKSNTYIKTGWDCAEKIDLAVTQDTNTFKQKVRDIFEIEKRKKRFNLQKQKAESKLKDEGLARAFEIYESNNQSTYEFKIVNDILESNPASNQASNQGSK